MEGRELHGAATLSNSRIQSWGYRGRSRDFRFMKEYRLSIPGSFGTSNGDESWSTVGVHENVIAASWIALEDALAYSLLRSASAS